MDDLKDAMEVDIEFTPDENVELKLQDPSEESFFELETTPTEPNLNEVDTALTEPNLSELDYISEDDQSKLYKVLGVEQEAKNKKSSWRYDVIHIRGLQEMSTENVMDYFKDYSPDRVEWVNDMSCNVIFPSSKAAATALNRLSKALVLRKNETISISETNLDVIDADKLDVSVPPYRWFLGNKSDKSKCLLLRFASSVADKKMIGARKHSVYYQKYGLPAESSRVIKHRKIHRIPETWKNRDNLERTLHINSYPLITGHQMRADEEEAKKTLSDRLSTPLSRITTMEGERCSVWDRLENSNEDTNSISRRVEMKRHRLRVVSRFSRSRHGPLFRRTRKL